MKDDFFVGIYDPIDVRRNILESSKEIVKSLQSHNALKILREEKLKQYKMMRQVMSELDMLMGRLEIIALLIILYPRTWFGRRVKST